MGRTECSTGGCGDPREFCSALLFELPHAFAESGVLPVHGPHFLQHPPLRVVETLHDRGEHTYVAAQAGDLADQTLQRLPDIYAGSMTGSLRSSLSARSSSSAAMFGKGLAARHAADMLRPDASLSTTHRCRPLRAGLSRSCS